MPPEGLILINSLTNVIVFTRRMELLISIFVISVFAGISDSANPCTSYSLDRVKFRSVDNYVKDKTYQNLLCDYAKVDGHTWYRFDGGMMTNTCTRTYHCGTFRPMWMNGNHPSATDGIVTREVCAPSDDNSNCCDEKLNIRVLNCGTFYVYELKSPPGCSMSYCAGTGVPCPSNTWSPTGYEPGCFDVYPKMLHSPHLSNPIVKNNTFEFHCDINFDPTRTDVGFDIAWMFDNKTDSRVPGTTITGSDRSVSLDQHYLEDHMQQEVSCKVRVYNTSMPHPIKGPFIPSNTYWAGIKLSQTSITASEKGNSTKVDLISTVPIICHKPDQHICHVDIRLDNNGHDIQATMKCTYRLSPTDWNSATHEARTTIEVQAQRDFQKDGDKNLELHFQRLFTADGPKIFQHVNIPYLHIRTQDAETATCRCYGDPHCKTFDYFLKTGLTWPKDFYDFYKLGEFSMYQNTLHDGSPSQVQIRTWSCGHVTCICAVAAREGNDVIVIDMCQGHYGKSFPQEIDNSNHGLTHGATMTKDTSGNNYLIDFPSGLQVKVRNVGGRYFTVDVTAPSDAQKGTGGLCGYFDGDKSNDLKHSDGKVDPYSRRVDSFVESWRVQLGTSLFDQKNTLVPNNKYDPDLYYCNCDKTTGNPDCKFDNNVKVPAVHHRCAGCNVPVLSNGLLNINALNHGRKKRSSTYANADYDPMIYFFEYGLAYAPTIRNFPTENGKSKADAEKACNDAFAKNPIVQQCITIAGMDFSPEKTTCVEDFKYFDDGSFIDGAVDSAIEACRYTVLPDLTLYKNGTPPAFITTNLCPNHCSGNGVCNTGVCTCNHGYTGDGCEINTLLPPQLHFVVSTYKDSIVCDISRRPCNLMFVSGNNMLNSSRLTCKVEVSKFDGARFVTTGQHYTTGTVYDNMYHVGCKLPTPSMVDGHTNVKYALSISNDGHHYSNSLEMVKIDPTCLDCGQDGRANCYIKDKTCLIDGNCHSKGETNTANTNQACDSSKDKTTWTSKVSSGPVTWPQVSGLTVAPLGGVPYNRFDIWTSSKTGCACAHDPTQTTCACCDVDGCQCPAPNQFQCVACRDKASCGTPKPGPIFGLDGYTLALNDCECRFDANKFDCACCNLDIEYSLACQCGAEHKNQCVNCNHLDQCGNKPWIFGPAFPK